jgi:diaminohydroxyphosphoribosylaminopyrimidine deaminase / 5-amino-6-(5-phosphoribosylamino)uracil reductase
MDSRCDTEMMERAIRLAMKGRGLVEPNPMVGCVLVKGDQVIGEGFHQKFGGPHAEVNALAACTGDPKGATAYVCLEPCCHTNKKTPPCTTKLIASRIGKVVAACLDPNPMVNGRGLEQLRLAGIAVEQGILEAEAKQLNAAFLKTVEHRRPYVTLKWAQTADGKVAGRAGRRMVISNSASLEVTHGLRSRCDAILVGIGTVLVDDPLLTARGVASPRPLLRVVLDSNLRISINSQLVQSATRGPVLVFCGEAAYRQRYETVAELNSHGVEVAPLRLDPDAKLSLEHALDELGTRGICHLLVEPGPTMAESFMRKNLADRVWIFRSPKRAERVDAPAAATIQYPMTQSIALDGDQLSEHLNPASPVFYSLSASADLVLAGA